MKIKICEICGRSFTTERPNKKYCSFSCREAGQKLRRMKWESHNPGYNTEYQRKYRTRTQETKGSDEK